LTDPKCYWIGFNLVKGIDAVRFRALLNAFGDAQTAWEASPAALLEAGLSQKIVDNLLKVRSQVSLERIWERMQALGIQAVIWDDEAYPARLKEIDQPPPVLYLQGSLLPDDDWAVAVVGTRRVTAYGRQVAEEIAAFLAANGITVVSGLARGTDSIAHTTALQHGGRTLAVLGSGLDRIYPPEHRKLAEDVALHGALISDYPPGTAPDSANFPPRNRIISGLSLAVVVVEAGNTSGALITASFAAEQGRDVLAVPGNIHAPQSVGTNRLIQQGAHPILDPQDILEVLNLTMVAEHRAARVALPADPVERQLFSLLGAEPLHVDELRHRTDLPIEMVTAALTMLELKGMVRQVGGMQYIALREQASAEEQYFIPDK
jgi:DNA processing protein